MADIDGKLLWLAGCLISMSSVVAGHKAGSGPSSYGEAVSLFRSVGVQVAVSVAVPVLVMVLLGGIISYKKNTFWSMGGYWVIVVCSFLSAVGMVLGFPYLLMSPG